MRKTEKMSFDELFELHSTAEELYRKTEEYLKNVRRIDCEILLDHPEYTPMVVYNKGFSVLSRISEELSLQLKHYKNGNK